METCIRKYVEAIMSEEFIAHCEKLSQHLLKGIREGYKEDHHESQIVNTIEQIINNVGQIRTKGNGFEIFTSSIFIHGNKSQVEFEYYGKKTRRELGDIIFILSIAYNGKKYFEKMTINQIKKSKTTTWRFNDSAKEQLYLLSRFPQFRGVKGSLIPPKEYRLNNHSGCLGTHGLLYFPGDLAVISSKQLERCLLGKNSLKPEDLMLMMDFIPNRICLHPYFYYPWFHLRYERLFYRLWREIREYCPYSICPFKLPIIGNNCTAHNAYEFSYKYLSGLLGELIYADKLFYKKPHTAFQFLQDLIFIIEKKEKKEKLKNVSKFLYLFDRYKYEYSDMNNGGIKRPEWDGYDGGGLGIIYTLIDLGEGKE